MLTLHPATLLNEFSGSNDVCEIFRCPTYKITSSVNRVKFTGLPRIQGTDVVKAGVLANRKAFSPSAMPMRFIVGFSYMIVLC